MTESEAKALAEWLKVRKGKTLKLNDNGIDCVVEALTEVQAYRAIGTIERFRELTEKAEPKKPRWHGHYFCPSCNSIVYVNCGKDIYCPKCGQRLDWK